MGELMGYEHTSTWCCGYPQDISSNIRYMQGNLPGTVVTLRYQAEEHPLFQVQVYTPLGTQERHCIEVLLYALEFQGFLWWFLWSL